MPDFLEEGDRERQAMLEQAERELRETLAKMDHEISLILFTDLVINEPFSEAARKIIRAVRELTPKIEMLEFNLSHEAALEHNAVYAPTLLFNPDQYHIRWLGAPMGNEGLTFVEALRMIGYKRTELSRESLKILEKIQEPRNIKIFVSPGCPYCPQQAVNALKAAIEKPEFISLEIIDIQANPDLAEKYSAFSVPVTYANELLIAQGAQPEELFFASLEKMEQQTIYIPESDAEQVETDLVIVGGGPAGLSAGIYAVRSGLKTAILEKGALGGQMATTPVVENYPGFTSVGGKALVDLMVSQALEYVQIFQGEVVVDIQPGDPVVVLTTRRKFHTRAVLMATGANHRPLGAKGETRLSGKGVSYCATCDGPLFKGKRVLVVGGGDSAVTEALHLHHMGVEVSLVHRRDSLRAQEHLTKNLADNHIPVLWNTEVKEIHGEERIAEVLLQNNKTGETTKLPMEGVFVAIGYEPAVELAKKIGLELTSGGFINRDTRHRTNLPGIYSAGDVEGGFKQIVTAAGMGAEAALSIFEDLSNPYWKKDRANAAAG